MIAATGHYPGLILRSVAKQRVSKDGATLVLRDGASRLLRMRAEREQSQDNK
jgi:hypothetical protein